MARVNLHRIHVLFNVTLFGRLSFRSLTALLTVIMLAVWAGNYSWAVTFHSIDYLNSDRNQGLENLGRNIEDLQERKLISAGKKNDQSMPSALLETFKMILDLTTRDFSGVVLQPANNPNASGGGQNISRDGNCVVGFQDSGFFTPFHAFRWTQATGPVDLGTLDAQNNSSRSSFATDTNQDCSVVVGFSDVTANGAIQHAFRWTSAGMVDLGSPGGTSHLSRAFGVSSDGTVVVGDGEFVDNNAFSGFRNGAFRWTGGSFQNLGALSPGFFSVATAVTGDGTVIVGQGGVSVMQGNTSTNGSQAFRWTTQTQTMQPIGPLPGDIHAVATGVSDNGKIVVGTSSLNPLTRGNLGFNNGNGAFRWTQAAGLQDLKKILSDNGVNMSGITLVSVTGISPDGQWIQGAATTPQTAANETVAFVAQVCDDDIGGPCSTGGGSAPFTIDATNKNLTVSAGQNIGTTITVTPNAGFNQPVTFSCGGLPVGAACTFNPATVTPAGGPVNTTLTISTNGGAVALLSPNTPPTMFAFVLTPFVLLPVGMLLRRRCSDRRLLNVALGFIATLTLAGMLSCSGSDSSPPASNSGNPPAAPPATGTPAGTSTVTVTATSGSSSSGVPVTLTVTR